MGRDKTKTTRGTQAPRPTAWERNEAARRDAARAGFAPPRRGHPGHPGPPHPRPQSGGSPRHTDTPAGAERRERPTDPKGIQRMESRTADARNTGHAQTANGRGAGGAGDGGSAAAGSEETGRQGASQDAARAANAARENPGLYAGRPQWAEPLESLDADQEPLSDKATPQQTEILAKVLGSMIMTGSRLPAQKRTAEWPPAPNGEPAGNFWFIPPEEALELGRAWAAVIAEFAPVNMIGGTAVLVIALGATGMSVVPRLMQDAAMAREFKAMTDAADAAVRARADAQAPEAA